MYAERRTAARGCTGGKRPQPPARAGRGLTHQFGPRVRHTAGHALPGDPYGGGAERDPVRIRDAKSAYGLDIVLDGLALRLPD
ncbi:hypothetical protein [Yinghuangia sp. YIM S09857]|uniref:hypothetical protein n=1 Tax=Yinghuangia sp. YIM S09857 TaxID=3436929 RepID=UPI003F529552